MSGKVRNGHLDYVPHVRATGGSVAVGVGGLKYGSTLSETYTKRVESRQGRVSKEIPEYTSAYRKIGETNDLYNYKDQIKVGLYTWPGYRLNGERIRTAPAAIGRLPPGTLPGRLVPELATRMGAVDRSPANERRLAPHGGLFTQLKTPNAPPEKLYGLQGMMDPRKYEDRHSGMIFS
eukprot:tig00020563_g11189.t1